MTRNTTRYALAWRETSHVPATLTATVSGSSVTFSGTGDASHVAGIMVGTPPFGKPYAYRLLPGDGPVQVAAAFASLIGGSTGAVGSTVTLLTNMPIQARVANDQGAFLETRRQDQGFRISVWSSDYAARDAVASAIDNALAYLTDANGNPTMNIVLASDNSAGWLRYRSTYNFDTAEKAGLYRRDLCYMIEYPTSLVAQYSTVLFSVENIVVDIGTPGAAPQVVNTIATFTN